MKNSSNPKDILYTEQIQQMLTITLQIIHKQKTEFRHMHHVNTTPFTNLHKINHNK